MIFFKKYVLCKIIVNKTYALQSGILSIDSGKKLVLKDFLEIWSSIGKGLPGFESVAFWPLLCLGKCLSCIVHADLPDIPLKITVKNVNK